MRFEGQFIEQVRDSCSIVHLIEGYVRLKKSGRDHAALCPFHPEKTPSFMVSESKQIFKCFGCGEGGDAFKFVMMIENLTFPESVRHLAERSGISLPTEDPEKGFQAEDRSRLLKIMEAAAQWFQKSLHKCSGKGDALFYLRQRQISQETIEQFRIGYAPSGNQLLTRFRKQGVSAEQLSACGLVKEMDSGGYYDKFRSRIMFPIRDFSGRTIAFGGRILGEGIPKYLNSPETVLYNKSRHLYALDVSREEIRRRDFAILVEGYFDCVVPFQYGIRNVVASLGTSLTQDQVRTLGRYTRKVVVNYDPDSAGMAATLRSIDLFLEQGFYVNILALPGGQDPDCYVRKEGTAAYQKELKSSLPYLDFVLSRFVEEQTKPLSPKGKQEVISRILPYLVKMSNRIERAEYVSRIASRLWVEENLIWSEIKKRARHREQPEQIFLSATPEEVTPAETTLLVALLEPYSVQVLEQLDAGLIEGLQTRAIFQKALELRKQSREISVLSLKALLDRGEDIDLLEKVALRSIELPLSEEMIKSSIRALRKKQYERISHEFQEEISREEKQDLHSTRIEELLVKKEEIRKKIDTDLL